MKEPRPILMLGTDLNAPGGISSVLRAYRQGGLEQQWPLVMMATWKTGSPPRRMAAAAAAWISFIRMALASPGLQAVHAHAAARGSLWRKSLFLIPAKWMGIRCILHLHDGSFMPWYSRQWAPIQALVRKLLRTMDTVIVLSPYWHQIFHELEPAAHWSVLPNPVSVCSTPARPLKGRVLFVGQLTMGKGIGDLLHALALCVRRHSSMHLIFAGDGDTQVVLDLAQHLGLQDRVRCVGWISPDRLQRQLLRAQLLVLPSHAEGLPMAVLEAMACGVPVVASDVGGIPEALSEGGGTSFPVGDVQALAGILESLLMNPQACVEMGRQGRASVLKRYTPEIVLARLGAIYTALGLQARHPGLSDSEVAA